MGEWKEQFQKPSPAGERSQDQRQHCWDRWRGGSRKVRRNIARRARKAGRVSADSERSSERLRLKGSRDVTAAEEERCTMGQIKRNVWEPEWRWVNRRLVRHLHRRGHESRGGGGGESGSYDELVKKETPKIQQLAVFFEEWQITQDAHAHWTDTSEFPTASACFHNAVFFNRHTGSEESEESMKRWNGWMLILRRKLVFVIYTRDYTDYISVFSPTLWYSIKCNKNQNTNFVFFIESSRSI